MRVRTLAVAAAAALVIVRPARAEPMTADAAVQDLIFFRDVWAAKEKSFTPEARARMLAFIGAGIVGMGSIPISEAVRRVAKFISGTPQRKRYEAPAFLTRIEVLRAIGLAEPNGCRGGGRRIGATALLKANSRGRMTQVGEEPSDDLRFWS